MKTTYFKVDRSIQRHWLWEDKPFSRGQAWIDLLLLATYTDKKDYFKGDLVEKKRGEVHVSIGFLCERWGWSKNKVLKFLGLLESEGMSTTKGTTKGTVITIENYAFYQSDYTTKGITESTPKGISKGTPQGTSQGTQTIKDNKDKEIINNGFNKRPRTIITVKKDHSDILNNPLLCDEAKEKWIAIREKLGGKQ